MLDTIWSIAQLVGYIKNKLTFDSNLRTVKVQGELGNFSSYKGSGHWYFTLKDNTASIRCAMFRGYNNAVDFTPKDGDTVIVTGSVNVYENRGELQLVVSEMQLAGQGNFYIQFERTRKKLERLGFFDEKHKRSIPLYPERIAVVTGANTAALQDIRITIAKRWPQIKLEEVYAIVQGKEAVESVVNALKKADTLNCDVLILARGGGSVDDLWCFNDEQIARAIYDCNTPVITGIGHEIDVTIADLVADVRAATPTAAAIRATPDYQEVKASIMNYVNSISVYLNNRLASEYQNLDYMNMKLSGFSKKLNEIDIKLVGYKNIIALSLDRSIGTYRNEVVSRIKTINNLLSNVIQNYSNSIERSTLQMTSAIRDCYNKNCYEFKTLINSLDNLSPLKTLQRGYSISQQQGRVIKSVKEINMNEYMEIRYEDGNVEVKPLRRTENG